MKDIGNKTHVVDNGFKIRGGTHSPPKSNKPDNPPKPQKPVKQPKKDPEALDKQ